MVNQLAKKLEEWWKYDDPEELFRAASQKIQEQQFVLVKCKQHITDPQLLTEIDKVIKDD